MSDHNPKKDPKEWLFKRRRDGRTHIDACKMGYMRKKFSQVHHALCVYACSDSTFPESFKKDDKDFVHLCLAGTDWKINAEPNVIGLPLKTAYVKFPDGEGGWDGWPCHQVDHDLYLKTVNADVTANIWKKVQITKKKKKCDQLKGTKLAALFKTLADDWRTFLSKRGKDNGGTKACLNYCLNPPARAGKINDSNWYIAFSMARSGSRVRVKPRPGVRLKLKNLLSEL